MAQNGEAPNQQNISEVLEMLKRSYNEDTPQSYDPPISDNSGEMTEDELKEKLRLQFSADSELEAPKTQEDTYYIDEDFLAEAESEIKEHEEEIEAESEEYPEEIKEEIEEYFDQLEEETEEKFQGLFNSEIYGEDDELTFDEIEELPEDDGIEMSPLELEDIAEDDITFDQIEEIEDAEEEIVFMHLELEPLEEPIPEAQEIIAQDRIISKAEERIFRIPEKAVMREFEIKPQSLSEEPLEEVPQEEYSSPEAPQAVNEDFLEELLLADDDPAVGAKSAILDVVAKSEPDGAEISLLMQFGCDDEIMDRYSDENNTTVLDEEAVNKKEEEKQARIRKLKEKVSAKFDSYKAKTSSLYIRLGVCAVFAFLLLLYEGLPTMGIELPGILNREDYYISYVLIGLQLTVLCAVSSYRQIWNGAKKLLTPAPDAYSAVFILSVATLLYDVCILFVKDDVIPPTLHFALVCVVVLSVLGELRSLTAERRCFELFFADILIGEGNQFTLRKSKGKNSTAEKMYKGGLDFSNNIYCPIEIHNTEKFFGAVKNRSKKSALPMLLMLPAVVLSLFIGIFALIAAGEFWVGVGGMTVALFMTLPTASAIAVWLPFERVTASAHRNGYAFASEGSMEAYGDCDIAVFSDLHLFEKCSPSKVNLALYDATSKEVLLGCLNAVYGEIGGPMSEAFSIPSDKKLGECRITRVAKSGVEAVIGCNYSVLLGSESFMSRYGIAFPKAALNNKDDELFTLCVSINGRATARIAVRYAVNSVFQMFVERLAEDGIYCAVETFDPMISTELLGRINPDIGKYISFVHMNAEDLVIRRDRNRERILFEASEEELGVIARGSRFNLVVALSTAKKMKKLRKYLNITALSVSGLGALIALAAAGFSWIDRFNGFFVLLYWLMAAAVMLTLIFKLLPDKNNFSFEHYLAQKQTSEEDK